MVSGKRVQPWRTGRRQSEEAGYGGARATMVCWRSRSDHIEFQYVVTVSIRFSPRGVYLHKSDQHGSQPFLEPIHELSLDIPVILVRLGRNDSVGAVHSPAIQFGHRLKA